MINNKQMRQLIIHPSLTDVGLYCRDSEELLIAIMAHESKGGTYLMQVGGGPAAGFYQCEPQTFIDLWNNELVKERRDLLNLIMNKCNFAVAPDFKEFVNNIKFATIMCRVFFLRVKEKLPPYNDIHAIAEYWKKYYNTFLGGGHIDEFISNYHKFIAD